MISEWFIGLAQGIAAWFLGLLPDVSAADGMIVTASNALSSVMYGAGALSAWMPWWMLGITFTGVLGIYVAGIALKVVLKLWSFAPLVGGTG